MKLTHILLISLISLMEFGSLWGQQQEPLSYQTPPQPIADLANAPQTPNISLNSTGEWMLVLHRPGYPSLEELAQPELTLAGLRINPQTNGQSRQYHYHNLTLINTSTAEEFAVENLPNDPKIGNISWSPNGGLIAFTITTSEGISLFLADVETKAAKKLTDPILNDALRGLPYSWMPNSQSILFRAVAKDRGERPTASIVPQGPVIQQTDGKQAAVRTYQDLLKNPYDEALFEYYATGELYLISLENEAISLFKTKGIYEDFSPSPDGAFVLVEEIQKPFSYLVPYSRFPLNYDVFDRKGANVKRLAQIPLAENIPKGFGAVRKGMRQVGWRTDEPATLYWVEAQDEGDPSIETEVRDQLFYLSAPFSDEKEDGISFQLRFRGIDWASSNLAIAYEYWWSTRRVITSTFQPAKLSTKKILFDRSYEDRYNDPGNFATYKDENGNRGLLTDENKEYLYLMGDGASAEGDRPFIRSYHIASGEIEEVWRSASPYFEEPIQLLNVEELQFVTRRQSKDTPPNYYLHQLGEGKVTALTEFPHPYPELVGVEKQLISYQREDGVDLSGDLYLPKNYTQGVDEPLPTILWAYPNEFKSADAAGQVSGSPFEFIRLSWGTPLYWVTRGYAVLDYPSMPVIGEGNQEPNDTFREQLIANAKAAIDKLTDMKVTDPDRVAIGGHSYGAFMTANLLAHSDLFAAGIARSGAYNRTLTPFGFQREERTYWEAPEIYYSMSPFMHAHKINEPMLMIHGEADNNSGTFPIQSKRLFAAMKGLGGKARLVMLPFESHGYRATESVMHMLWEMDQWLEKYVKNNKKGSSSTEGK